MRKMTLLAFALFVGVFASAAPAKKRTAKDAALAMADRIVASTTYQFKNTETGETYPTVKKLKYTEPIKVGCIPMEFCILPCSNLPISSATRSMKSMYART